MSKPDIDKLMETAEQGSSDAQADLGCGYYFGNGVKQDYEKAVMWLTKAANQNHPEAQYVLSFCYL